MQMYISHANKAFLNLIEKIERARERETTVFRVCRFQYTIKTVVYRSLMPRLGPFHGGSLRKHLNSDVNSQQKHMSAPWITVHVK